MWKYFNEYIRHVECYNGAIQHELYFYSPGLASERAGNPGV